MRETTVINDQPSAGGSLLTTHISACPHPFAGRRIDYVVPAGLSIAEIVELIQPDPVLRAHGVAFIGEHAVPRDRWHRVRPKAGALLSIRLLPSGSGARIAAMIGIAVLAIALAVAAPYLTPLIAEGLVVSETAAAAIYAGASAAIVLGATLAVNYALPPPVPQLSKNRGTESPTYAISGARNQARPWEKLVFLCGRFKLTPAYAAMPYREVVGAAIYWRALFALGHGPIAVDEMRVGKTLLADFQGVETEFRRGYWSMPDRRSWNASSGAFPSSPAFADTWTCTVAGAAGGQSYKAGETITFNGLADAASADAWDRDQGKPFALYPDDVYEDALAAAVKHATPVVRASQVAADEIGVELIFDRGLAHIENKPPGRRADNAAAIMCIRLDQL